MSHAPRDPRPVPRPRRRRPAPAAGLLVPEDKKLPPLAMVNHQVTIAIDDQVAVTTVEQTFRNHTDRQLEATYLFPVPKGASVNKFTMWVDGKETTGELVDAKKASQVYTDIVRRTQDPGLLEYMGNNLMRLQRLPGPAAQATRRWRSASPSVAPQDNGLVEYVYPLKTDGKGDADARGVLDQGHDQVAAPDPERLQPDARHHASTRNGDKEVTVDVRAEPGRARQGLPALLQRRRQGRSA